MNEFFFSSLNHLLDLSDPQPKHQNITRYQSSGVSVPTLNHNIVYLPATMGPLPEKDVANFDLGYYLPDEEDLHKYEKDELVKPEKPAHQYKVP